MRLAFVFNRYSTLAARYTGVHIAFEAQRRGHAVHVLSEDELELCPDGRLLARARRVSASRCVSRELFVASLQRSGEHLAEPLALDQLDVLLLRANPLSPQVLRLACRLAEQGVQVLNSPHTLARTSGKLYLRELPELPQPRTLISRQPERIKAFLAELDAPAVLKPLDGYGGDGVLYLRRGQRTNLDVYLQLLSRMGGGYVVVQEYLEAARRGDKRVLLVDGEPLGAYRRLAAAGEHRNNVHVGGRALAAEITPHERQLCRQLAPQLRRDGLFLVGLDLVDSRVIELNLLAAGGVDNINRTAGLSLAEPILDALEQRVASRPRQLVAR